MKSFEIVWLALAIVLTTATQLRPESIPIGPGEAMLVTWILLKISGLKFHAIAPLVKAVFWFWLISLISGALGALIAESMGVGVPLSYFYRDSLAFILSCIFSLCFAISVTDVNDIEKISSLLMSFAIIPLFIMFAAPSLFPFLEPWYANVRFIGWARNPNQIALLLGTIPFLSLHLLSYRSKNSWAKILYVTLVVLGCLIVGNATDSDALRMSWIGGLVLLIFLEISRLLLDSFRENGRPYKNFISSSIVCIAIVFLALVILLIVYREKFLLVDVYDQGSQGENRVILWNNGINAISHSPLFGLGPGGHSGANGPFLNFEAHNTFIDWAGSCGIVGLISYVALLGWIGWNAWKNRLFILLVGLISLAGFSSFHYVLRHPIFWFYLLSIGKLSMHAFKDGNSPRNTTARPNKGFKRRYKCAG